jgi:acetolactate synthase-1/3 small subunit
MINEQDRHVLALLVDNEAGVLGRVVGLFSGRGYNIHSLTVAEIDTKRKLSRITITTYAPEQVIAHIITLLEKLVPVHQVRDLTAEGPFVQRGLLLVKVHAPKAKREEILHLADNFGALEVDTTSESFMFELNDIPSKLNEFEEAMSTYGIIEIARTGVTALARGKDGLLPLS